MSDHSQPPVASPSSERELLISHTFADGTLLTGTTRADDLYQTLRSLGWLYRRSASDYRLQGSLDRPAKRARINTTAAALHARGFTVRIDINNTIRPAEHAEIDRADRADDRADRLDTRADRLRRHAAAKDAAGRQVLDNIPPGQPYLVDHHSYRADRRRRERALTNLDQARELDTHAEATERQADTARDHMKHRYSPETVANRIRSIEAELRAITRTRADSALHAKLLAQGIPRDHIPIGLPALTPDRLRELDDQQTHLNEQLRFWQATRAAQIADCTATNYTNATINRGDLIAYRGIWYLVLRVNTLSVSVPSAHGVGTSTIRYEHIRDHVPPTDPRWQQTRAAAIAAAYRYAGAAGPHPAIRALDGTVPGTVFPARHAGLRSGGMGTVSDGIRGYDPSEA